MPKTEDSTLAGVFDIVHVHKDFVSLLRDFISLLRLCGVQICDGNMQFIQQLVYLWRCIPKFRKANFDSGALLGGDGVKKGQHSLSSFLMHSQSILAPWRGGDGEPTWRKKGHSSNLL